MKNISPSVFISAYDTEANGFVLKVTGQNW